VVISGLAIRTEGRVPESLTVPSYLRYADRDAIVVTDGVEDAADLEACLTEQVHDFAVSGELDDLSSAVLALDAVDRCFRESGLWSGNIYLAGVGALEAVLNVVQSRDPAYRDPTDVLRELAALELAYLFPIARKFRSGDYDGQVQYRLNGWGRSLAGRLASGGAGAARASECRRRLSQHLADEHQRYSSFLSELDVVRQDYPSNQLDGALELPIPVLV